MESTDVKAVGNPPQNKSLMKNASFGPQHDYSRRHHEVFVRSYFLRKWWRFWKEQDSFRMLNQGGGPSQSRQFFWVSSLLNLIDRLRKTGDAAGHKTDPCGAGNDHFFCPTGTGPQDITMRIKSSILPCITAPL